MTGGLTQASVKLIPGDKEFNRLPTQQLAADQLLATAVIETDAGDALPVVIKPSRLRYQLTLQGEDPMWRTEPIDIAANWIDTTTKFRVRPGIRPGQGSKRDNRALMESARVVLRNRHGSPVRTLPLETKDEVTWWVDLAAAAPSLATLTQGSLELEFVEDRRVSVRLARILPDFTHSAQVDANALTITATDAPEGFGFVNFAAWVWPTTAPWRRASFVALDAQGVGDLPADLVDAGPLSVQLVQRDRFNYLRAPVVAGARSCVAEAPGFYRSTELSVDPAWAELSAFFAGEAECPPTDPVVLSTLWDVQAGWLRGRFAAADKLQDALTHNPRESVHAMSRSLVPAADRPAQFIASGLVHSKLVGEDAERSDSPWIAALEVLGDLAEVDFDSPEAKQLRAELKSIAGAPVAQTVETGRDVSLDTACIDNTTVQIAHMDPAQQKAVLDMVFGNAGVVPGALSEENSRLIAVFATFEKRRELSELLGDPEFMKTAVTLLRKVKSSNRQLYLSARVRFDRLEGVDTDKPANRWALAPVISMIFALATRMYAHGKMTSLGKLRSAYPGWAEMARLVPDLVTGDLVMAEAMVLGTFGPSMAQE